MDEQKKEREFEIGKDEIWFANVKRSYDEYQDLSLELTRKINAHFDKLMSDAAQHDNDRQVVANLALKNAVTTSDMVAKRSLDHWDVYHDRVWNIDEVSTLSAKSGVQADLIQAIAAAVTAEVLKRVQDGSIKA